MPLCIPGHMTLSGGRRPSIADGYQRVAPRSGRTVAQAATRIGTTRRVVEFAIDVAGSSGVVSAEWHESLFGAPAVRATMFVRTFEYDRTALPLRKPPPPPSGFRHTSAR